MRAPLFWQRDGMLPRLLAPASAAVAAHAVRRAGQVRWRAPIPVICCGNATVGGSGKTTLALDLGARLLRRGVPVAFITRGYGGRAQRALLVGAAHDASTVGDEALLLAGVAPTWVGADRAASARAASAAGARVLIMDDGLQNPGLAQDLALLVIDGAAGFGNGRVLPGGPLREDVALAVGRCRAAVLIGPDGTGAAAGLALPVLRAALVQDAPWVRGQRVLAFAGIGRPDKFFATLVQAGAGLAGRVSFPDHHRYRPAELRRLRAQAAALGAALVTTPKDAVRLPPALREGIREVGVSLRWEDEAAIEALLREAV